MSTLTVAEVSGIIALCVYLLQWTYPNLLGLVLIANLNHERSAVTWSVASRELQMTLWPTLLRSDTSASSGVSLYVTLVGHLRFLLGLLVGVAAIITPLGLYNQIGLSAQLSLVEFSYVPDIGPFGYGTPPRDGLYYTRACDKEALLPAPCPGTGLHIDYTFNRTSVTATWNGTYDIRIPEPKAAYLQSGLNDLPHTVSSFFDIQYRQYTYTHRKKFNHDKPYPVGSYRPLTSVILDNATEPVEGLIIDSSQGRIGFRNHSAPTGVEFGAEWSEDLLFIEPRTSCVDTNLTVEFQIATSNGFAFQGIQNAALVDQGGFVNLNQTYPEHFFLHPQKDAELPLRAYKAAWWNNAMTMLYLNVTRPNPHAFKYVNSHIGKRFPIDSNNLSPPNALIVTDNYGSYLGQIGESYGADMGSNPMAQYKNPFHISFENFTETQVLCSGAGGADKANITHIGVHCGLMFGAAKPKVESQSATLLFRGGSWWTQPIYSCASAPVASIKTVHFRWNTTSGTGLKPLQVVSISDKSYESESDMPFWAVEDLKGELANIQALWGLISEENAKKQSSNYSVLQSSQLVLPGYGASSGVDGSYGGDDDGFGLHTTENVPASTVPTSALVNAYETDDTSQYSGARSLAMFVKWRQLSRTVSLAPQIINLIWTDVAANALIGSKSNIPTSRLPPNLQKRSRESGRQKQHAMVPVRQYENRLLYHWPYAIPAFLTLFLVAIVVLSSSFAVISKRASPKQMAWYLDRLSSGRLLGKLSYPGSESPTAHKSKDWIEKLGQAPVSLAKLDKESRHHTHKHVSRNAAEKPLLHSHVSEVQTPK